MPHHHRFGVLHRLEFEQHVAAATGHGRAGAVQHQAFTTRCNHRFEPHLQGDVAGYFGLLHRLQLRPASGFNNRLHLPDALGESGGRALRFGQLKHHVLQLLPLCIQRLRAPHCTRQRVKRATAHPQLAIQWRGRQFGNKPGRRRHRAATAKAQGVPVP